MYRIVKQNIRGIRNFCTAVEKAPLQNSTVNQRLVPLEKSKSRIDYTLLPPKTVVDAATIALLERLSLVDCESKEAIRTLEAALEFADQILQVDTANVEPLVSVLEDKPLRLRTDEVDEGNCKDSVLKNAALIEEDYFVTPPGNIPLETREELLPEIKNKNNNAG